MHHKTALKAPGTIGRLRRIIPVNLTTAMVSINLSHLLNIYEQELLTDWVIQHHVTFNRMIDFLSAEDLADDFLCSLDSGYR